jgi:hypothetical protein
MDEPSEYIPGTSDRHPLEEHLKSRSTWLRLFFMIVISVLYAVARLVTTVVVIVQFCHVLFTGGINEPLREFGQSLATYAYQIVAYLTFNTEAKPFPFDTDWPHGAPR